MKYFFLLSEKFYRFIEWEWNTLKNLRRTKRKNFFLRGSFALFSLFSIIKFFQIRKIENDKYIINSFFCTFIFFIFLFKKEDIVTQSKIINIFAPNKANLFCLNIFGIR